MGRVFTGVATALVTPFTEDGIDEKLLARLIERQIGAGVDALVVLGTTGEPCALEDEERDMVLARCVECASGRVPVIAGVGSNDTASAMRLARLAREAGADALLAVTPYYNKCAQDGLVAHFERVAEAGRLPTILYNVPSRTGMNMLPQTAARLARHPLIVGLKEAGGDMAQLAECAYLTEGQDFAIYSGCDELCLPAIAVGAAGLVSVVSNVAPEQVARMVRAALAREGEALPLARRLSALTRLLFSEVSPIPCKAALRMMGLGTGKVRLPLTPMPRRGARLLREELIALGLATAAET